MGTDRTEADICREDVTPMIVSAGWDKSPHMIQEQRTFTDGRIVVMGNRPHRRPQKRADYLLKYTRDFTIAVVEAKDDSHQPGDGLQQAKEYAEILGLKFAYSTNGKGIVEFDYMTGQQQDLKEYPTPDELWNRLNGKLDAIKAKQLLTPYELTGGKIPRYYQEIAINQTVQAILTGQKRVLITMATGTGKTTVAFQICWKLWNSRWNRKDEYRRPKILFLADRNVLIDDPKDKDFAPFKEARAKVEGGVIKKGRDMYFALYQSLANDQQVPLYKEFEPDFFDLIVVDECHRGSARNDSTWREILEYFADAYQVGMTATPLREDNRDTYDYFGEPIYSYTLRQGIEDGFLAPYRVHRVVTTYDAAGWRPNKGELDRFGREIPDGEYHTRDFERVVALRARTEAIARHLTNFLKNTDPFSKTIVFCVDQEHALEMIDAIAKLNPNLLQQYPDYVCRVTSDEGDIGIGHLRNFQDPEKKSPVILTSSQMLTTGVDATTVKNVVLVRVIGSMSEFKQIIGRGTRVNVDYGKLFFNIIDYTGCATQMFADPQFDGEPIKVTKVDIDSNGGEIPGTSQTVDNGTEDVYVDTFDDGNDTDSGKDKVSEERRKYYFDGGSVEIAAHIVHELDPDGKQLKVVKFTDYTAEKVRTMFPTLSEMRVNWSDPKRREELVAKLKDRGIGLEELAEATKHPEADPFDLLCHLAYGAPLLTRRQRAEKLRKNRVDFFDQYGPEAKVILGELLQKYADHGSEQLKIPDALKVPPISNHGTTGDIIKLFDGPDKLRDAVGQLQSLIYTA